VKPWYEEAPPAAEQAAEWLVALASDDPAERADAQDAFAAWKLADPRHAAAAAPIEALLTDLAALREDGTAAHAAQTALQAAALATQSTLRTARDAQAGRSPQGRPPSDAAGATARRSRRRTLSAGMTLAVAACAALLAWHSDWAAPLHADLRTGTGEWARHALPDGTQVALGSDSAVDWRFDQGARALRLLRGEVLVDVAPDAARPLTVRTPQAEIRALGTRLLVQNELQATQLTLLESAAAVQATGVHAGTAGTVVRTGGRVRIAHGAVHALPDVEAARVENDWLRHELVVVDAPLPELLRTLARHRPGRLGFDADRLAHVRVTAVLPLDQPDRALALLATSFPELRISRFTNYWVSVGLQNARHG